MLRHWRFLTLLLVSLSMGMTFCHALELVPKMAYDAALYLSLHRTLYLLFGAPVGAAIEVGAVLSSIGLIVLVRGHRSTFAFTVVGAVCMLIAHVIWWIWVNPANRALIQMTLDAPAAEWIRWRNQWEYTHLVRFVVQLWGFAMLLLSVLVDTPRQRASRS
jgi:hypothetical protein